MIWKHEKYPSNGKLVVLNFTIHWINQTNLLRRLYQPADKRESINNRVSHSNYTRERFRIDADLYSASSSSLLRFQPVSQQAYRDCHMNQSPYQLG